MGNGEAHAGKESSYWELTAPPSVPVLPNNGKIEHIFHIIHSRHIHEFFNTSGRAQVPPVWEDWHARLTWPTVSVGLTTMVCASIPLMWKSSPEIVISCFANEIFHCRGLFILHTLILSLHPPLAETRPQPPQCVDGLPPPAAAAAGLVKSDLFHSRKAKQNAQGSGNSGTRRTCTSELFMQFIWLSLLELLQKGSFSASEELNLEMLSLNLQAYFV